MTAPIPVDERERLAALRELNLLDTPAEERFDRVTRLACRVFDVPIAVLSLVDADRQWFKSVQGLRLRQTPRSVAFCGHTILGAAAFQIPDAHQDDRFRGNPLVTGGPLVRFYAGHPVVGPDGRKVGALAILDRGPRLLGPSQLESLADLAGVVEAELRVSRLSWVQQEMIAETDPVRRQGMIDPLTQSWSRRALLEILTRELTLAARSRNALGAAIVEIDRYPQLLESRGRAEAEAHLAEVSDRVRSALRPYDAAGRVGERQFLVILPGADLARAASALERVRGVLESPRDDAAPSTVSVGVAAWTGGEGSAAGLFERAHRALLRAREEGGNRVRMAVSSQLSAVS